MSLAAQVSALATATGAKFKSERTRNDAAYAPASGAPTTADFFEQYALSFTTSGTAGYHDITTPTVASQAKGSMTGNRFATTAYGFLPVAGLYSFGVSLYTTTALTATGRIIIRWGDAGSGGGNEFCRAEADWQAGSYYPGVNATGKAYMAAGTNPLGAAYYASGSMLSKAVTGFLWVCLDRTTFN